VSEEADDRVIRIASAATAPTEGEGGAGVRGWLGLLAALVLVAAGFMSQARFVVQQIGLFPPLGAASEKEFDRLALTGWPTISIIANIKNVVPKDELTLVFRQADFAFYAERPYIFYLDPTIAAIYRLGSAEEIWAALRKLGVRWILVPAYGLSEINETKFVDLLTDPEIAPLIVANGGYRLFQLNDQRTPSTPRVIAQGQFGAASPDSTGWTVASYSNNRRAEVAIAEQQRSDADISFRTTWPAPFNRNHTIYLSQGTLKPEAPMNVVAESDLPVVEGPVRLSMDLEGKGNIELRIVTGRDKNADEIRAIWAGALLGESRTVKGLYLDQGFPTQGLDAPTRRHRIQLVLKGPGQVRVKSWKAEFLQPATPPWRGDDRWLLSESGWSVGGAVPPPPKGQLALTRLSGEVVQLRQDLLEDIWAESAWVGQPGLYQGGGTAQQGMDRAGQFLPVSAWADVELGGSGAAALGVRAVCPDGRRLYADLGAVALEAKHSRVYREAVLDCVPVLLRLVVTAKRDVFHDTARPRRSRVEIGPVKLGMWIRWSDRDGRHFTYEPFGSIMVDSLLSQLAEPAPGDENASSEPGKAGIAGATTPTTSSSPKPPDR
jgi:hypothetical protein